jgi:prefoldin subunit 5
MSYFGQNAKGKETLFNVGEKIFFEAEIEELDQKSQGLETIHFQ